MTAKNLKTTKSQFAKSRYGVKWATLKNWIKHNEYLDYELIQIGYYINYDRSKLVPPAVQALIIKFLG